VIDEALGPGGIPLTVEQRAAIDQREGPLLVAAGAGSGKTLVLVERFVRSVLLDGVDVDSILAITFTDRAAAQLRDRIRRRFLELGAVDRAREAEEASISTIHGFCARLLRAFALRAGLDPQFAVADQEEADRLARRAFDDALERVLDEGGAGALDDLAPYSAAALRDMVVAAHGLLRTRGEARPELPPVTPRDPDAARAALEAACAELAPMLSGAGREADAAAVLVECRDWVGALEGGLPRPEELPEALELPGRYTDTLKSPAAERYREALEELRGACLDRELLPLYERLRSLLVAFRDRYAELKAARSVLDFADLELEALGLLEDDPVVRDAHRARYRHVMVDEFQDTNPLQVRLLAALVGASGSLFTVGDALQAIYRFRHADVRLFEALRAERDQAGLARGLARNFRSARELVAVLNVAWAEELFRPDAAPLRPRDPDEPTSPEPPVELLITAKEGWDEEALGEPVPSATAWRLAEARLLAHRVRELLDDGRRARDVVVLVRATTHMALYERTLEEAGVATYLIGGRGFWSGRQVQDLVAYLALLANPRDDLRLYEVLASPLAGVSADALVLLADAADGVPAWIGLERALESGGDPAVLDELDAADRRTVLRFVERFRAHRTLAPRVALDALIERVMGDTGYDVAVLRMPGAVRRMANVRKLVRLAREFEAREGRDLRGLVDRVDELAGAGLAEDREGEAPVEGEALEAVRIMTMHRAKGLEFPVVCVADLGREPFTRGREHLRIGPGGEVGLRVPQHDSRSNGNGSAKAFAWEAIGRSEAEADAAEERRLHYVAMTRAEELLVLSGAVTQEKWRAGQGREAMRWIADAFAPTLASELTEAAPRWEGEVERGEWTGRVRAALSTAAGDVLPTAARRPEPAPAEPQEAPDGSGEAARPPVPAPPLPSLPVDHLSYSALEAYGRCGYRFYLRRVLELPELPVTDAAGAGLSATARGSIVHALLEDLDLAMPAPVAAEDVRALAGAERAQPTDDEVEEVIALVERFARSDVAYRLGRAAGLRREEQFTFVVQPPGGRPVLVTGVVDAIGREGDGRVIVDYKTDRLAREEIPAHVERDYAGQRLIYALAALRDGAAWVEVVHCFLEHPDDAVTARFEAADEPRLAAELEGLAAGIANAEFPVTDRPHRWLCQGCPGRVALCSHPEELTMADPPPD
jgi:ATP-dependent exoDNAse (exonuclease V) beta subunit